MGIPLLIVEDDRNLRESLEGMLVDDGYDVAAIDSVAGAREAVAQAPFRCVLLDLTLVDGRADELLVAWSQSASSPNVVLLSAGPDAARLARYYGVIVIRKPYDLDVVRAAVKVAISQKMRPSSGACCGDVAPA